MIDSPLRLPYPRRVDSKHRPPPTPDLGVRPHFGNLVGRFQLNLRIYSCCVRQKALQHDEAAGVAVEFCVLPPTAVETLVDGV